jgi:hypothetical protein
MKFDKLASRQPTLRLARTTLRLEGGHVHSPAELNTSFSRWIAGTYHLRVHNSTNMSPHERFTRVGHPLRTIDHRGSNYAR